MEGSTSVTMSSASTRLLEGWSRRLRSCLKGEGERRREGRKCNGRKERKKRVEECGGYGGGRKSNNRINPRRTRTAGREAEVRGIPQYPPIQEIYLIVEILLLVAVVVHSLDW